ncbi:MAG: DegT/DnrJ/EryC1/StrS family aminotransferase [Alphaproteobacteria bacterium]
MANDKLRDAVHDSIRAYCESQHDFGFKPNNPLVRLHEPTFGAEEIIAAVDVLLSTKVTMGPKVKGFEREYAAKLGYSHAVMNNSGSSANLLAVAAAANPAFKGHLKPGDEVIVPALSWSTTVWPLIQCNLVPVIVDIDPRTLNINPDEVERAIGPKTRGIMPVHVYGNPCDMGSLTDICRRRDLMLIEDCCEAMGAWYDGVPVGKFGLVGTFSFYFSHHITTLEGGMCVTEDFEFAEVMRSLRAHGWTRELEDRERYLKQYPDIDPRFLFINVGYNLRATELQGAFGSVQLPKLDAFVETRRRNTESWRKDLKRWEEFFLFQEYTPKAISSCFGFPMTRKDDAPFTVREFMAYLNAAAIETRPIIAGNIAVQPALKLYPHRVSGDLKNSTRVMTGGVTFGNHQTVDKAARDYVTGKVAEFMKSKGLA